MSLTDTQPVYFGIGRRKTSVAKVIVVPGNGVMLVNHKPGASYLQFNSEYINASKAPLTALRLENLVGATEMSQFSQKLTKILLLSEKIQKNSNEFEMFR